MPRSDAGLTRQHANAFHTTEEPEEPEEPEEFGGSGFGIVDSTASMT
jgi:hypothetical protein